MFLNSTHLHSRFKKNKKKSFKSCRFFIFYNICNIHFESIDERKKLGIEIIFGSNALRYVSTGLIVSAQTVQIH